MASPDAPAVELSDFSHDVEPTCASVSYQLAHDTVRELEARGDFATAAELLALALAEEAQRINQRLLANIDLATQPDEFKSLNVVMAEQQSLAAKLLVPRLEERAAPIFARCLAKIAQRPPPREPTPRPGRILDAIAKRWHLPRDAVARTWADFLAATDGSFTLSLLRAQQTLLAGQPDGIAQAMWNLARLDPAKVSLMNFADEPAALPPRAATARAVMAVPSAVTAVPSGRQAQRPLDAVLSAAEAALAAADSIFLATSAEATAGGAGGLNFEEYVVLRGFATSTSLEAQFRFLWRLVDRDADGTLSREDLDPLLHLQRVRFGWDEEMQDRWRSWVMSTVNPDAEGRIGPAELKAALKRSVQLRMILLAAEPPAEPAADAEPSPLGVNAAAESVTEVVADAVVKILDAVSRAPQRPSSLI